MVFTIGSIFCRYPKVWEKKNRVGNFRHHVEGMKNLTAETSGIKYIFLIQMTINNRAQLFKASLAEQAR